MTNTEAPERAGALIQLTHVHLAYPGSQTEALSDVSCSIPTGQHVCILGGNGSGKSTLLQLVNVLALPTSGAVHVAGIDTREPGRALEIRSRTASVFQHPEDQMVTSIVADDVAFGPENLRIAQPEIAARVDAALAAVGMKDRARSDPSDLSGGQVQRVAIAGALAMEPDILLLDEPCAMLDVEGRESVRTIIRNLRARGMTILHVTHFMEDAQEADRAIVLQRGRVAFDGTPSALFSQPDLVNELGLEMPGSRSEAGAQGNDVATDVAASGIAIPDAPVDPSLVFEHVSFSYERAANPRKRTRKRALFGRRGAVDAPRSERAGKAAVQKHPLAVEDLSFEARPGTITALIGHTGSGKSTTAELACALKLPTAGAVRVGGIDTADLARRRELRGLVGYVAQLPERQLFAETVFDDVAFGPRNLGLAPREVEARVHEALRSVNLAPTDALLASSPFALSGGQQRSVALAGVLAMKQPILVLDEPMAGLDPAGRAHVRALLKQLRRQGTTLLMVTHSMEDVAELADQVIALDGGRRVDGRALTARPANGKGVSEHGPAR